MPTDSVFQCRETIWFIGYSTGPMPKIFTERIQLKSVVSDLEFVQVSSKLTKIKCQYNILASPERHKAIKLVQHNLMTYPCSTTCIFRILRDCLKDFCINMVDQHINISLTLIYNGMPTFVFSKKWLKCVILQLCENLKWSDLHE